MRTIPGRLGLAWSTCDYNAISVHLQLQLPTGTELGKNREGSYRAEYQIWKNTKPNLS